MSNKIVKLFSSRYWLIGAGVASFFLCASFAQAQVVVVANGSPITEFDIQQRTRLLAGIGQKAPARKDVINELIDDRLKIARAKSFGFEIPDKEVDTAFKNMADRQHITIEQFSQVLERSGVAPQALKDRLRAEMTWNQLVRGKFSSSLVVGDADIASALKTTGEAAPKSTAYLYTLYPITIVMPRGANEATLRIKQQEAENLRARFLNCKQGLLLARAIRDVAVREPVSRSSSDLPPQLRDLLGNLELGRMTPPEVTPQGLQMFALCEKKKSFADTPEEREARNQIFGKRFDTESKRYLEELRKQSMIEYK